MRPSDYFAFIPLALATAVVFALPAESDQGSIAEVRSSMSRALSMVSDLVTGEAAAPVVLAAADPAPDPCRQTGSMQEKRDRATRNHPSVKQTWENRPAERDYANGRGTRLTYGESQRDCSQRARQ